MTTRSVRAIRKQEKIARESRQLRESGFRIRVDASNSRAELLSELI
jgi:hypothetical protein